MMLGVSSAIIVQTIELGFIGQLGTSYIAAITFTFPVVMILNSIALGISIGTSSLIARAIGAGHQGESNRLATHSLILVGITISLLSIVGWLTIDPVFLSLGASPETLLLIHSYLDIYYPGTVLFTITMIATSIMRAHGNANLPGAVMTGAALINLLIDPFLIFGWVGLPRMELAGAATAMLITRVASSGILLYSIFSSSMAISRDVFRGFWDSARQVLHIGIPAMTTQLIGPVSSAIVTRLLATHGEVVIAGFGVATRIEALAVMLFFALSGSIGPFVGQNAGAKRYDRVRDGLYASYRFCMIWGAVMAILLLLLGDVFASWIDDKPEVISVAAFYLALVPWSYGLWGILMMSSASFNALGKPMPSTIMSFTRMFILNVPLALAMGHLFGYKGIFLATLISNATMGTVGLIWFNRKMLRPVESMK